MSIPKLLLVAFVLIISQVSFSQALCGFDQVHGQKMKSDPLYRSRILQYESNLRKYILDHPQPQGFKGNNILGGTTYNIPVVVHVVHTGGAIGTIYNPTDLQIQGAIDYLNQVYNGTYPGLSVSGAGDLGIQFVLAKRDPNCNATNGITRTDGSAIANYVSGGVTVTGGPGTNEINVKNLIRWDPAQYYNIWIVDKLDGNDGTSGSFIAGFAYFPGGNPNLDGTIMLATQMVSGQKTLPHEIGHAFNLYHPFEGSTDKNTCPVNANCNINGDQVCDTDPITYNQLGGVVDFTCRSGINSCNGLVYSANTESNFMNYTNCYTLFTAGQKTRMQASAASPDRISLANSQGSIAPDQGTNPCTPKINFELDGDQQSEVSAGVTGCRNYKDYTYNLIIGSSPSAAATATLNVNGGTATEGLDFDITTNGNFTSPSKTLNFPAGSNSAHAFTIRIYDDASVEGTENFSLNFTVNAGGGNATAGDGRPVFTMVINDNDIAPTAGTTPQGIAIVGSSATTLNAGPFDATQQSQRVQFQYKASELTTAGISAGYISSLSLFVQSKLTTRAFTGLTINLGKSSVTNLISGGSVTIGSSMTTVMTTTSYTTIAGWNNFNFNSFYLWDGTSNLVVEMCFDNGTSSAGGGLDLLSAYLDGGSSTQGNMFLQNGINCSQSFTSVSYYASGRKPFIKLGYGIPQTVVQTVLNSSRQEYLGPNADVYFYDQTNSQLMARIQNNSNFDYGCTQVTIDRAGTNATPFWNNNPLDYLMDKTFRVLPTTNNPSGNYTITLYYTQAEISGWQSATGQNLNSILLVKTSNAISSVTPSNPGGGGTMITATPLIISLGTNTGLSYNFTSGFSGFGAGVVGTVLSTLLTDFAGELKAGQGSLHWTTSSENNSRGFYIERSVDGSHFTSVGYVAAAGNSSTDRMYSFTDPEPAVEKNYYRLREVDNDNQYQYSKTILLTQHEIGNEFKILRNPFVNSIDVAMGKISDWHSESKTYGPNGKSTGCAGNGDE